MIIKVLAMLALLLAIPQGQLPAGDQTADHPVASRPAHSPTSSPAATPPVTASSALRTDCEGSNCDSQPSHITVATPAPAPAPWLLQDRILWGAYVLLALLGYAGIMLALSTLRKIERQTRTGEATAAAAAESAQAALLHAQFILHSERPWVLISVVPSPTIENGFNVTATNRGRGPARIVKTADETRIAMDEAHLPGIPEFGPEDRDVPPFSVILLSGEQTVIKSFCRDNVKGFCESEERLRRIENWEERIFIYGKIVYRDLMEPIDQPAHETIWCFRYIHGRQKSGLVMAGTQEYNMHT
jgi:hypothetical protein